MRSAWRIGACEQAADSTSIVSIMPFETRPGAQILLGPDEPRRFVRTAPFAPWASISSSLIGNLGKPGTSGGRVESHTTVEFPLEFCLTKKPCPQLAGIGVRAKKLLGIKNINVYAAGVYFDGSAAKKALGHKYKDASTDALLEGFVSDNSIEKTLRLVIHFSHLRRSQFVDALNDRLAPEMKKAGDTSALDPFKQQFDTVHFKQGLEITFTQSGSQLVTKVDGKELGRLSNQALSHALWVTYLGTDPVSPDLRSTTAETLAAVVA